MAPANSDEVVVHKHWFGLLTIYVIGILAAMIFAAAVAFMYMTSPAFTTILAVMSLFALAATFIQLIVYRQSTITITPQELQISNASGLFSTTDAVTD